LNKLTSNTTDKFKKQGQIFYLSFSAAGWVVGVAVGVPMGFIIILQAVIIIMLLVRRSPGSKSEEKRTQPSNEYEEVGLTVPTSSKNQGATEDVPARSAESEEKRAQSYPEYEEVGLRPISSKNQGATRVPAQSAEYETTSFQAKSDDHVYERVTKQTEQACYENTSTLRDKV